MTKKSIILTLAALTTLGGLSFATMPALAATSDQPVLGTCSEMDPGDDSYIGDNAGLIAQDLSSRGYKISGGIEDYGGCVRTYVTQPNGQKVMAFFDPTTLERIDVNG